MRMAYYLTVDETIENVVRISFSLKYVSNNISVPLASLDGLASLSNVI